MQNNLAKDLLPHAIMLFVLEYTKRHNNLEIIHVSGNSLLDKFKSCCDAYIRESEVV